VRNDPGKVPFDRAQYAASRVPLGPALTSQPGRRNVCKGWEADVRGAFETKR